MNSVSKYPVSERYGIFFPDELIAKFTYSYTRLDTLQLSPDLYFKSAIGFGKWRLLFSSSCLRDREQSRIVLNKLKYMLVVGGESGN